ncbi:MAG TPA: hypothetical protein EYP79_02425 [Campylobacterales bacterium]|nr:hypothetical protein [Campylobacterales bacterium]
MRVEKFLLSLFLLAGPVLADDAKNKEWQTNENLKFKEKLIESKTKFIEQKSRKKAYINPNIGVAPPPISYEIGEEESLLEDKKDDKFFKKILIKNRAKINPDVYHYKKVKSIKELKGVEINGSSKAKKVYNFIEVKNVHGIVKNKNIGIQITNPSNTKEVVNIVEIKNSSILGKKENMFNTGVVIKKGEKKLIKTPKNIYNEVTIKNSNIKGF